MTDSRKNTLRRSGYIWTPPTNGGDAEWNTTIDDKFLATTWKFGNIHQCKVFIKYDHRINGKKADTRSYTIGDDYQAICLGCAPTRDRAMQKMVEWIHQFQPKGLESAEKTIKRSLKKYPDLYPNRIAVLDHLFFTIGNGYGWLDGAIIDTSQQDDEPSKEYLAEMKKMKVKQKKEKAELDKILKELKIDRVKSELDDYDEAKRLYWSTGVYRFYPVSKNYSDICLVPDDVRPDWLKVAYEAALLLRDHSGIPDIESKHISKSKDDIKRQADNRKIGAKIAKDLEKRFPHLKGSNAQEKQQVSA